MITKLKKRLRRIVRGWLHIPGGLGGRIDNLKTWSLENERRRHLLHNSVKDQAKEINKLNQRVLRLENKLSEFEKKERALQRHFGIKYLEYFTYEFNSKKVRHLALEIDGKIHAPVKEVSGDIVGGTPPWRGYKMEDLDHGFSVPEEDVLTSDQVSTMEL